MFGYIFNQVPSPALSKTVYTKQGKVCDLRQPYLLSQEYKYCTWDCNGFLKLENPGITNAFLPFSLHCSHELILLTYSINYSVLFDLNNCQQYKFMGTVR